MNPLTPKDCDLRDFQFMPMDVRRLLKSETWVTGSSDEKCAAMSLWMESWHEVPAASVPNNDKMLSQLSGAGSKWAKVKAHVLRGWVDGCDGRLYHPVVAEKALEAWIEKLSAAIAGNTGNAKRWQIEIDSSALHISLREAVEQLKIIAPRSKTLSKKTAKVVQSQSLPVSPPDSQSDSGSDRNRQGQGQGQGLEKPIGGNACAHPFQSADFDDGTPMDDRPRIPMTPDWQPGPGFLTDRAGYGFRPETFSAENLSEFRGYWSAKPDRITQAEWEHRLAARLKEISSRPPSRASPMTRRSNRDDDLTERNRRAVAEAKVILFGDQQQRVIS